MGGLPDRRGQRPYELPDRTPPAPGWGEWFNDLGKYMCTPI